MILCFFHKEESNLIPVDQLGQKLLKKIGISWNKKYRKQYGPLRKVIHDICIGGPIPGNFTMIALQRKFELGENKIIFLFNG